MEINIPLLSRLYFFIDKPVEYVLLNKNKIFIYPVKVIDSEYFLSSIDIFTIDKNSAPDVKIIQMSYLQFLRDYILKENINKQKFVNILLLCLGFKFPELYNDERGKPFLKDKENPDICITASDFENIRRIILYQNILHYDDEYINPDLKKAMQEVDELKNKNIVIPTLERKIGIIMAHTGILKENQLDMTLRTHEILFEEVYGEVEFSTIRPIALFAGEELEHWIYKKKKNKFDQYITDVQTYSANMGGQQNIKANNLSSLGENYLQQFNNFSK